MPWTDVPAKWKAGQLHSGSPRGPRVTNPQQMVAILLNEKRKAADKPEYRAIQGFRHAH